MQSGNTYRTSPAYIWSTNDILGKGATSYVYLGRHKQTGDLVAIKVFHQPQYLRESEFEVLSALNHENIVKFFCRDFEQSAARSPIIVMEYCSGGSLFTVLEDPQNQYGFQEDECLRVVRDVAAGMNHLREKNVVHRDLKPGNIMRVRAEDGNFLYKLTDFGAAAFLEDDENFHSLYGTEEYLHPDMYERALMRRDSGRNLKATVDLWSIGATFFHTAAGQLPFQPYGGRNNREIMYKMISEKRPGVISGKQPFENGNIVYSTNLPLECLLSNDCKDLLEPILAGILESDPAKGWNFAKFFEQVQAMLKKVVIHVFILNLGILDRVYLSGNDSYFQLRAKIQKRFNIPASLAISFMHNNAMLEPSSQTMSAFPSTSRLNPLIVLVDSDSPEFQLPSPTFSFAPSYTFTAEQVSVDQQFARAKEICADTYRIFLNVNDLFLKFQHTKSAIDSLIAVSVKELRDPTVQVAQLLEQAKTTNTALLIFRENDQLITSLMREVLHVTEPPREALAKMAALVEDNTAAFTHTKRQLGDLNRQIDELHEKHVVEGHLSSEWRSRQPNRQASQRDVDVMRVINEDCRQIFENFRKHKLSRAALLQYEEMKAKFDRQKMVALYGKAMALMGELEGNVRQMQAVASVVFGQVVAFNKTTIHLLAQLQHLSAQLNAATNDINSAQDQHRELVETQLFPAFSSRLQQVSAAVSAGGQQLHDDIRDILQQLSHTKDTMDHNNLLLETLRAQKISSDDPTSETTDSS